eukprot:COSAG01_NODE_11832_length_1851_cov_1.586758_3_plen_53_part_00
MCVMCVMCVIWVTASDMSDGERGRSDVMANADGAEIGIGARSAQCDVCRMKV